MERNENYNNNRFMDIEHEHMFTMKNKKKLYTK